MFNYSFDIWPDETWNFHPDVYTAFGMMGRRLEMEFDEAGFERFRSNLSHHGLTLRSVERVPHNIPEAVP